jgi:hypothetical protein
MSMFVNHEAVFTVWFCPVGQAVGALMLKPNMIQLSERQQAHCHSNYNNH